MATLVLIQQPSISHYGKKEKGPKGKEVSQDENEEKEVSPITVSFGKLETTLSILTGLFSFPKYHQGEVVPLP